MSCQGFVAVEEMVVNRSSFLWDEAFCRYLPWFSLEVSV